MMYKHIALSDSQGIAERSALASAIVKEHYDPILGSEQNNYMIEKFQSVPAITDQLGHGYQYYLVQQDNGADIGFMAMYPRGNELYLSKFYLHKDYRGRGLSRQMLSFVEQQARKAGADAITLNVNKYNSAVYAYEKLGFHRIRDEVNDIGHGYVMDDYVYEYPLS